MLTDVRSRIGESIAYKLRIPIVIFESTERTLLRVFSAEPLCLLLMLTLLRKILRVFSWRGALWFLPATFALAWDALFSCLRSCTFRELAPMTRTLSGHRRREGIIKTRIPTRITYLTGAAKPMSA